MNATYSNPRAERLGLEPGAAREGVDDTHSIWRLPTEGELAHSQAISLKRIADALEKLTSGGIPTDLWSQINCLAWEAGQQFGRGAQTS